MRILLLILAALLVAGGTGFYVLQGLQVPVQVAQAPAEVAAPKPTEVFVPAVEMAAGTIIVPEQLGRMQVTEATITPEMVKADEAGQAALVGSVARQVLPKGVPIARSAIVQPGDRGFLAAVLPKGKRAISIPIGEVAGISGLLLPGDRVDIILTYSIAGDTIDAERDIRASETVMTNLRVLALDQRLQASATATDSEGKAITPPIARTATLEVTPQEAEMITLATSLGDLSLVLNSVRDGGEPELAAMDDIGLTPLSLGGSRTRNASGGLLAIGPRQLTLDSDVTSLLRREPPAADAPLLLPVAADSAIPLSDRTTRVQVVRGNASRAVEFAAEAVAAAAPVLPTAPTVAE